MRHAAFPRDRDPVQGMRLHAPGLETMPYARRGSNRSSGRNSMSDKQISLDFNASTPLAPEVVEAMRPFLTEHFGNPSSHDERWSVGADGRRDAVAVRAALDVPGSGDGR